MEVLLRGSTDLHVPHPVRDVGPRLRRFFGSVNSYSSSGADGSFEDIESLMMVNEAEVKS